MAKKKSVKKKTAKRTINKPTGMGKVVKIERCAVKCDCVKEIFVRLCVAAVMLFILTVCPKCLALALSINPFWYLAAALIFFGIHITRRRCR